MSTDVLEHTGERMIPEASVPEIFWEHVHRYRFAKRFVRNKRVLDIACGEGYGAFGLLRAGATSVVGVDISEDACGNAKQKYGIDARCGSAESIPLPDTSVDVVVSFETIEHISDPARFVREAKRVLTPSGAFIVSTPNRPVYNRNGEHNPFHCAELDEAEFITLLKGQFRDVSVWSQASTNARFWSPRCFSASQCPWRSVRGFWFLRKLIHRYSPWEIADDTARKNPDRAIGEDDSWRVNFLNPCFVRKRSYWSGESPTYLIAVCRNRC
jgi:SAM-dependent methyltransferase